MDGNYDKERKVIRSMMTTSRSTIDERISPLRSDSSPAVLPSRTRGLIILPGISLKGQLTEVGEYKSPVTLLRKAN